MRSGCMPTSNQTVERRSPKRPMFEKSWRKILHSDRQIDTVAPAPSIIEIWIARSDELLQADSCLRLLTDEDWSSLEPMQHSPARESAIASRILLRLGLSSAVERSIEPSGWAFSDVAGRPRVAAPLPAVHYSVSHTDSMAVVAISSMVDVGIDIEDVDQDIDDRLLSQFLHDREGGELDNLRGAQRAREFVKLWTMKESYTKLLGLGHTLSFQELNFSLEQRRGSSTVRFETFFESHRHSLSHIALALNVPSKTDCTVQMISLRNAT
jgi:phosphopantetheinyl transferase